MMFFASCNRVSVHETRTEDHVYGERCLPLVKASEKFHFVFFNDSKKQKFLWGYIFVYIPRKVYGDVRWAQPSGYRISYTNVIPSLICVTKLHFFLISWIYAHLCMPTNQLLENSQNKTTKTEHFAKGRLVRTCFSDEKPIKKQQLTLRMLYGQSWMQMVPWSPIGMDDIPKE